LLVYEANSFHPGKLVTIDESNPYYQMIHQVWGQKLRAAFMEIPEPSWNSTRRGSAAIMSSSKELGSVPIEYENKKKSAVKPKRQGRKK
jgi:putative proteasome-type protease